SYVLNNPLTHTDESGEFVPLLIYGAVLAYRAYSAYDTVTSGVADVKTLASDSASTSDKVISSVSLIASIAGGKVARESVGKLAKKLKDRLKKPKRESADKAKGSKPDKSKGNDGNTEKEKGNGGEGPNEGGHAEKSDEGFLREVATRAEKNVGGEGAAAGSKKHKYADKMLRRYQRETGQRQNLAREQSYRGGERAKYGDEGSARPDVFDPQTGKIYDYKFTKNPGKGIPKRQKDHNVKNVPNVTSQTEINPL
ncbi:MAG: hypothetical protein GY751_12910, partial [Bacteroidetes bacterium]|nr:hypothetical protein [Bacteroidota bacterium]